MPVMTISEVLNQTLKSEMKRDPSIVVFGEDVALYGGTFGITNGLLEEFGEKRVRDTPITESAIAGAAAGAAVAGLRPVVEIMFIDFITLALDMLLNQAAKMRYMFGGKAECPMVLRAPYGGGLGAAAQHSQCLEAWLMHIPGIKVVMPTTPYDTKGLFLSSIRDNNPVVFLEHKMLYFSSGEVPEEEYTIPLGKADIKRQGSDVTVVATGMMVERSLSAAEKLSEQGIDVEVLDPRTLLPLDEDAILDSVKKTHRLVIVHEEVKFAGSGAEISAMVAEKAIDYLDGPIMRVGAPFTPVPFAPALEAEFIPSEEKIIDAVKTLTNR
jgi:pyruvate/2-oxoglutarate/acetoin dehydrogenase E1 component